MFYSQREREREKSGSYPTNHSIYPPHLHQNRSFTGKRVQSGAMLMCFGSQLLL